MIKIVWPWFVKTFRPKGTNATTFIPYVVVFSSKENANNPVICNHEAIHGRQMLECFLIGSLVLVWWWKFFGYNPNPFEEEAYANQKDLGYLKRRGWYAWTEY